MHSLKITQIGTSLGLILPKAMLARLACVMRACLNLR